MNGGRFGFCLCLRRCGQDEPGTILRQCYGWQAPRHQDGRRLVGGRRCVIGDAVRRIALDDGDIIRRVAADGIGWGVRRCGWFRAAVEDGDDEQICGNDVTWFEFVVHGKNCSIVRIVQIVRIDNASRRGRRRYGVLAQDEGDSGAGDFRGDFRGGIAASASGDFGEVHARGNSRGLFKSKGEDRRRRRTMVVRFLFWLASRMSRQIPLFDFDSELRLAPGKRFAAVNANAEHHFLRGEITVGVRVLSEGNLDAV